MMKRTLLGLAALSALALPGYASAAAWSRAYVAEWLEPAFFYGASEGEDAPGTDCPAGSIPENDWKKLLKTSYRTDEEIAVILDPEKSQKNRVGGIRGPNKENVYEQPWSVPDPGLQEMTGKVAFGFDLDGDAKTGFASPDGKSAGIDNQYYKAAGCWMAWRGPARGSHHAKYVNDGMRDGVMSILVLVSGNGADPDNDDSVTVAFYMSKDKMVKDANGNIAGEFSFRVDTDPRFQSLIKARTRGGVVESTEQADLKLRDCETAPFFPAQLQLLKGRIKLDKPSADGKVVGLLGGYRPIEDYWKGWAASGVIHESTTHINLPGYWYSLRRHADYAPDKNGQNTAISTAYQVYLTPAFLVAPDAKSTVTVAQIFPGVEAPPPAPRRPPAAPASPGGAN